MLEIRKATLKDVPTIDVITKRAFRMYQDALIKPIAVKALNETEQDVIFDLENNNVYVAEQDGVVIGSIRFKILSSEITYIYRFGVDPTINNTGVGSELIQKVIDISIEKGASVIALHTNSKYYKLARYYYGKEFFVHSTTNDRGYIRALFLKELKDPSTINLSPAHKE